MNVKLPPNSPTNLYWWHGAIYNEVAEYGPTNTHAIASNLRFMRHDTEQHVADLVAAGLLRDCAPVFDYPARWVEATPQCVA